MGHSRAHCFTAHPKTLHGVSAGGSSFPGGLFASPESAVTPDLCQAPQPPGLSPPSAGGHWGVCGGGAGVPRGAGRSSDPPHKLLSLLPFPTRTPREIFRADFQWKAVGESEKRERQALPHGGFPASSCLACAGNGVCTEARGLAVPLPYPSPVHTGRDAQPG